MLYQGLLRREEDEPTVQTACRNTWTLKRDLRDRGILKGPTRADHHRVPGEQFSTKRPDTFTQTVSFAQLQTSCSQAADHTFERKRLVFVQLGLIAPGVIFLAPIARPTVEKYGMHCIEPGGS